MSPTTAASVVDDPWRTSLLAVSRAGPDRFRGALGQANAYGKPFGGQLLAHALAAADRVVDCFEAHSLHSRFLAAGRADQPIEYQVERLSDGRRFCARRSTGWQNGRRLFEMTVSYRSALTGFDHQIAPLTFPVQPEDSVPFSWLLGELDPPAGEALAGHFLNQPVDIRVPASSPFLRTGDQPRRQYWLKARRLGEDTPAVHREAFAYLSDLFMSGAGLVLHAPPFPGPHVMVTSLDHAIWFHRPLRCDDWLLFDTESPSSAGGTSLSRASVFDRAGVLVASVAQESLQLPVAA